MTNTVESLEQQIQGISANIDNIQPTYDQRYDLILCTDSRTQRFHALITIIRDQILTIRLEQALSDDQRTNLDVLSNRLQVMSIGTGGEVLFENPMDPLDLADLEVDRINRSYGVQQIVSDSDNESDSSTSPSDSDLTDEEQEWTHHMRGGRNTPLIYPDSPLNSQTALPRKSQISTIISDFPKPPRI